MDSVSLVIELPAEQPPQPPGKGKAALIVAAVAVGTSLVVIGAWAARGKR